MVTKPGQELSLMQIPPSAYQLRLVNLSSKEPRPETFAALGRKK